jgi:hypothetical protein
MPIGSGRFALLRAGLYYAVPQAWQLPCADCERLVRAFQEAWRCDQEDVRLQFQQTAAGRDPEAFVQEWVVSLAKCQTMSLSRCRTRAAREWPRCGSSGRSMRLCLATLVSKTAGEALSSSIR